MGFDLSAVFGGHINSFITRIKNFSPFNGTTQPAPKSIELSTHSYVLFHIHISKGNKRHMHIWLSIYTWTLQVSHPARPPLQRSAGCPALYRHCNSTSCTCILLINSVALYELCGLHLHWTSELHYGGSSCTTAYCTHIDIVWLCSLFLQHSTSLPWPDLGSDPQKTVEHVHINCHHDMALITISTPLMIHCQDLICFCCDLS